MRKVSAAIAAAVVIAAGGTAVVLAPSSSHKPSLNDIGSGGNVNVLAYFGKLSNETDPTAENTAVPTSFTPVEQGGVWHAVRDFTTDQVQQLNIGSQATGAGAGKVTFNPTTLTIPVDQSYAPLFTSLASGTSTSFVRLEFLKPNQPKPYMQITMKLVALKELTLVPNEDSAAQVKIGLQYGGYQVTMFQNANGSTPSAPIVGGWNAVRNVSDPGTQPIG